MSHVGIERFRPGHSQHNRAEQHKTLSGIRRDQIDPIARIESPDDGRKANDRDSSKQPDRAEPGDNDRAKIPADTACPAALNHEEGEQQVNGST